MPIYESFFQRRFIIAAVKRYHLRLMTYDVQQEERQQRELAERRAEELAQRLQELGLEP